MVSPKRKNKGRLTVEGRAIIVNKHREGRTPRELSDEYEVDLRCVKKILFDAHTTGTVVPPKRKGRKKTRVLSKYSRSVRMVAIKNNTATAKEILMKLNKRTSNSEVVKVQRILAEDGGARYLSANRCLCLNAQKMSDRVTFCRAMTTMDIRNIIWGDEKWYCIDPGPKKTWVFPNQPRFRKIVHAHPLKILVWGGISCFGRAPLYFFQQNIDSDEYCKVMDHVRRWIMREKPGPKWSEVQLQQDNARPHVSRKSLAYAASIGLKILPNWPAGSPDLNCVEHMWNLTQPLVQAKNPRTLSDLQAAVDEAWGEVCQKLVDKLVWSPYDRFQKCIDLDGAQIDLK